MSHEVETMFSRDVPWHGLGTVTGEALTAEAAIKAAELDWTVEKRPVYFNFAGKQVEDERHFVTVRSTDGRALGIVGRDFTPLQNAECFQVLDDLVADGELHFDSAGSLRNGQIVWVAAELPTAVRVPGEDDGIRLFAVLTHGHDGTRAIAARITPILPVCMNTLTAGERVAKAQFKVPHRANAKLRITQGRELLGLMTNYAKVLERQAMELSKAQMELAATDRFLKELYRDAGSESARAHHVEGTKETLQLSPTIRDESRATKWGVFMAVTEWADWKRPGAVSAKPETRVRSSWEGFGHKYRERAITMLTKP